MIVGRVGELWRYPVKSMAGERLTRAEVNPIFGIPGDRAWALRDEDAGEIRGAKRMTNLLDFVPRYLDAPSNDSAPPVEITMPSGQVATSADSRIDELLSAELGKRVTLWPRQPATDLDHYRRRSVSDEADLRDKLALLPGEPLPDFGAVPAEIRDHLAEFVSPLGTYFDAYPLSLITTASMNALAAGSPGSVIDSRRFRQNIVADTGERTGFIETEWAGRRMRIGSMLAEVTIPIPRCVMITVAQRDIPQDRSLMRTLVKATGQMLGIYLNVLQPGTITEGDPIEVLL